MKQLIWKLVFPLTIILFTIFTKWWYVLPVDAPDSMMNGFPLIWISEGWHTSMSYQVFIMELLIDFFVYFIFLFAVIYAVNRFFIKIKIPKLVTILLLSVSGLICCSAVYLGTTTNSIYTIKRDFDIEVLTNGYQFIWQDMDRPKYEDYKPRQTK